MTTKTTQKAYALMWVSADSVGGINLIHTLVYRPPSGPEVRTYLEGHLDRRAGEEDEFARFEDASEAIAYFRETLGQGGYPPGERPDESRKALVEVRAAKRIRPDTYADPV